MQSSLSKKPQPEPENKYPDCLYLKLEGIPVERERLDSLEFWQTSTQTQQIDLHLTLHFNEQWESLSQGRVKFGLKGGELRVKLENSEIPYESRELAGSFELLLQKERQEPEGTKNQKGREVGAHATNSSLDDRKPKEQANFATGQRLGKIEEHQVTVCHVTTKVSEENPAWVFEEEMGGPVLKGLLDKAKLATLHAIALPCRVEATFEVSKRDVCLTDVEGLWPADISHNKRAVLARLIVQRLLEPKFQPYLSRAELQYD
jgi:hypothetical protein